MREETKVTQEDRAYLGRIVDRARGVYRSREWGMFSYDLVTGEFGPAQEGVGGPRRRNARAARPRLAVSFGDAFLLNSLLRPDRLMAYADECGHAKPDMVRVPLACVLSSFGPLVVLVADSRPHELSMGLKYTCFERIKTYV